MIDIKVALEKHSLWLQDREGGERANLYEADLREADLRGANLREADLRRANLQGANLQGANLQGAVLMQSQFPGANLQGTNLLYAYLWEANLHGANLQGAYLQETDLYDINLTEANINHTALDPRNTLNTDYRGFKEDGDYIIGYRSKRRLNSGSYSVGDKVKAPYFSTCKTECHPGLYLYPTVAMVLKFQESNTNSRGPIIKVRTKKTDIHRAGDKWRCKEFEVLAEV